MGYPTPIEWTDASWNPVGGCSIHSPGCNNCYAMPIAASGRLRDHVLYRGTTRTVKGKPVFNGILTALPDGHQGWNFPLTWRGSSHPVLGAGQPSLIFVGDMADLMHRDRPVAYIDRTVLTVVISRHIGQLLTKRADIMADYFLSPTLEARLNQAMDRFAPAKWHSTIQERGGFPNAHLWLGWSAERPQEMSERERHMHRLARAGWQTFVSIEPLLERTQLPTWFANVPKKPWVIVGGESGPDARVMHPDWVREIRDHAGEMGCPFFFKQWGQCRVVPADSGDETWPAPWFETRTPSKGELASLQFGKKRNGRDLDGRHHNAFPVAA